MAGLVIIVIFIANVNLCGGSDVGRKLSWARKIFALTQNRKLSLALPKGTQLHLPFELQIPFSNYLNQPGPPGNNPGGINATWHFYLFLDNFGSTINDDLDYRWPLLYGFSGFYPFGRLPNPRPAAEIANLTNEMPSSNRSTFLNFKKNSNSRPRKPREILSLPPAEKLVGGERATFIPRLESFLDSMGYNGRACLLRAVCEIHEVPLWETGYGLLGEVLTLIFTISRSDYAQSHLPQYLEAEEIGKKGDCSPYFKNCTRSLFTWEKKPTVLFV